MAQKPTPRLWLSPVIAFAVVAALSFSLVWLLLDLDCFEGAAVCAGSQRGRWVWAAELSVFVGAMCAVVRVGCWRFFRF
jgi:hypothetical protein